MAFKLKKAEERGLDLQTRIIAFLNYFSFSANIKCSLECVSTTYCLSPVSLDYSGGVVSLTRFLFGEKLRKYAEELS